MSCFSQRNLQKDRSSNLLAQGIAQLVILVRDFRWFKSFLVALDQNPNTPVDTQKAFQKDSNRE